MVQPLSPEHPLRRLFAGTVHQVLYAEMGLCEPQIAEYLAEMLSSLIHMDDFYPFRDASGARIRKLAEMVTEAELPEPMSLDRKRRLVHRHIGDFSLFWTGLFPEGLCRLSGLSGAAGFNAYLEQGKRSYAIASDLTAEPDDPPPATVLRQLSENFEHCVYGLNLCRREWDVSGEHRGV